MSDVARPGLYGVGVGPGDPRWLTLRAVEVLRQADVIALPQAERAARSRTLTLVEPLFDETRQEWLPLPFATSGAPAATRQAREASYAAVAARLTEGRAVAVPVLGDPLLYGSFTYLFERARRRLPDVSVEIVPGVTSFTAAAARAGRPLARGAERLAVLPAVYEDDLDALRTTLQTFDTTVLLKVNHCLDRVLDLLAELGLADQAWYAEQVGLPEEWLTTDLEALRGREAPYFSLLVARGRRERRERGASGGEDG